MFARFGVTPVLSQDILLFNLPGIKWGGIQCEAIKAILRKEHRQGERTPVPQYPPEPSDPKGRGCPWMSLQVSIPGCSAVSVSEALFELAVTDPSLSSAHRCF